MLLLQKQFSIPIQHSLHDSDLGFVRRRRGGLRPPPPVVLKQLSPTKKEEFRNHVGADVQLENIHVKHCIDA